MVAGFGEGARGHGADGVAVGTAVVRAIQAERDDDARVRAVTTLVASLRAALDEA
jgi:tryptophan synthase alpha subunit